MKILLHLLVLSSLSSLILARIIGDRLQVEDRSSDAILIKNFTKQRSSLNIINDDPIESPFAQFFAESNSPVKKGKNIKIHVFGESKVDEYFEVPVKFTVESSSHVHMRTINTQLTFRGKGFIGEMNLILLSSAYCENLNPDNKVLVTVSVNIEGMDQAWSKQLEVQLVE